MPIYEFECKKCHKIFEYVEKSINFDDHYCPICHEKLKKVISLSNFKLKGDGWYATDYKESKQNKNVDLEINENKKTTNQMGKEN